MGYVQGKNRDQAAMFPAVLDEYIGEDNQVRFIDAFVDHQVDMSDLGFRYSEVKETGRRVQSRPVVEHSRDNIC